MYISLNLFLCHLLPPYCHIHQILFCTSLPLTESLAKCTISFSSEPWVSLCSQMTSWLLGQVTMLFTLVAMCVWVHVRPRGTELLSADPVITHPLIVFLYSHLLPEKNHPPTPPHPPPLVFPLTPRNNRPKIIWAVHHKLYMWTALFRVYSEKGRGHFRRSHRREQETSSSLCFIIAHLQKPKQSQNVPHVCICLSVTLVKLILQNIRWTLM